MGKTIGISVRVLACLGLGIMVWQNWIFVLGMCVLVLGLLLRHEGDELAWQPRNMAQLARGIAQRRHFSAEAAWGVVSVAKKENPESSAPELWDAIRRMT